jgi:ADP-ribosyl-[dinitrogen reductase] hydrolase
MENETVADIGLRQIDAILAYLPIFEQEDYEFGQWVNKWGQVPYFSESQDVVEFQRALYREKLIIEFDWTKWSEELEHFKSKPGMLKDADLRTLRKILTAHSRADRFVERHFVSELESGHIIAVLRRLQEIRDDMISDA